MMNIYFFETFLTKPWI